MKKFTTQDIKVIENNIADLLNRRMAISIKIYKERQKIYNIRKYQKRKLNK